MELIFIFRPAAPKWWNFFLKPGFHHIAIFIKEYSDPCWVLFDYETNGLSVASLHGGEMYKITSDLVAQGATVINLDNDYVERDKKGKLIKFGLFTCVTAAKLLMKKGNPWVHTPYQLRKYLATLGAVDVTGNFQ